MMTYDRYELVRCKITGQKMLIKDVINKGFSDERYNCKYHNRSNGLYEYVHKTASELDHYETSQVGFRRSSEDQNDASAL
jgi:hypothetical protein